MMTNVKEAMAHKFQISHHGGSLWIGTESQPIFVKDLPTVMQCGHYSFEGDQNYPISVEKMASQGGDKDHPIHVEERAMLLRQGSKRSCPIYIDDDHDEGFVYDLDDPNGKKPIKLTHSRSKSRPFINLVKLDVFSEPSSSAVIVEPNKYCFICMEAKYASECFNLVGCSHVYCASCISQYVAAKVEENVVYIGCPDMACQTGFLEPEMCRPILSKEVFDRWGTALCESMITGSRRFYCPYKDCSALLIDESADNGEVIIDSECPHCFRLFCAQCRVPWHIRVTCEAYQKLGVDERSQEDLMLMQVVRDCHWQRCPKCKFYVERTEGCMFMKCRCGFCFCYQCGTETRRDHYCEKCKR